MKAELPYFLAKFQALQRMIKGACVLTITYMYDMSMENCVCALKVPLLWVFLVVVLQPSIIPSVHF
jgi:hypothetical protein